MLPFPCALGVVKILTAHFSIWYFLTFAAYSVWTAKIKLKMWKSSQMNRLFSLKIMLYLSFILCFHTVPSLTLSLGFLPSLLFCWSNGPRVYSSSWKEAESVWLLLGFVTSAHGEVIQSCKICSRVGWGKTFILVEFCWSNRRGTLNWDPQNT